MNVDAFFGTPRWHILEIVAEKPVSPSDIALSLKTSVSYVSQQLKLLEAAGLIIKEKTGLADKGKPRSLYSISQDFFHLTILSKGWSSKKVIPLSDYHRFMLKFWFFDDKNLNKFAHKFYPVLEKYIKEVDGVYLKAETLEIIIVSSLKLIKQQVEAIAEDISLKCKIMLINREEIKKFSGLISIYAPERIVEFKQEKGEKQ